MPTIRLLSHIPPPSYHLPQSPRLTIAGNIARVIFQHKAMNRQKFQRMNDFSGVTILHDQTQLIDSIINAPRNKLLLNELYNYKEYVVELSDSFFIGVYTDLTHKEQEIRKELDQLLNQGEMHVSRSGTLHYPKNTDTAKSIAQLRSDLNLLKGAKSSKREVFQWLLVPFWFSAKLIDMGEVVFRLSGNCWWGTTSLKPGLDKTAILYEVYLEVAEERNTKPEA